MLPNSIVAIFYAKAQEIPVAQLLEEAKHQTNFREYVSAIKILEHLKDMIPENNDYPIYLARVYGWKKDYSKAITTLRPLTEPYGFSPEAITLMVTTQSWVENYEEVIHYSDFGFKEHRNRFNSQVIRTFRFRI